MNSFGKYFSPRRTLSGMCVAFASLVTLVPGARAQTAQSDFNQAIVIYNQSHTPAISHISAITGAEMVTLMQIIVEDTASGGLGLPQDASTDIAFILSPAPANPSTSAGLSTAVIGEGVSDTLLGFLAGAETSSSSSAIITADLAPSISAAEAQATSDTFIALDANKVITASNVGYANLIAKDFASGLQNPVADLFAFTSSILANTNIKAATGTNGVVDVTQAIADDFAVANITGTSANLVCKEEAVDAGIKALSASQVVSGSAAQIVSQAAAQVLTTATTIGAKVTFATNFIAALDASGNPNFTGITANDRAYAAIGLAEACDSHGVTGASAAVSATAVATYDSNLTDLNNVAQPILEYFSANTSGTETGSIAAAISQIAGTYTFEGNPESFTPAYLAAQLILAAKVSNLPNFTLVDQIALGTAASSGLLSDGYGGSADTYLSGLAANLNNIIALPFLKNIATYLAGTPPYSDTEIVGDFATGLATVSNYASEESGTIAAVVAAAHTGDAAAIAHAAAANVAVDTVRETIAEDVVKNVANSAVAVSGSVALTITGDGTATSTQGDDLGALAKGLVTLDQTLSDDYSIALNVANALPANDTNGLPGDLATIVKQIAIGWGTLGNKTIPNVVTLVSDMALGYTGGLGSDPGVVGYSGIALFAKDVAAAEAGLTGIGDGLAGALVSQTIGSGSNDGTAVQVATAFAADLPSSAVTISATAAALDSTISTDAASLTSGILGAITPTDARLHAAAVALALAQNADGGLTATEAEAIADTAAATAGISTANQNLAATNVIGVLDLTSTASAQTALNVIANTISGTYTGALTLFDQKTLAKDLANTFPLLDQASIAYNVANVASANTSYADIADILYAVLKPTTAQPSLGTFNSITGEFITDLTGNTNYTEAAGVGAQLATAAYFVSGTISADISEYLVNQELVAGSNSITNAVTVGEAFTKAFPATAATIASQATASSLYTTALTPEESGTIGAAIAASLPTGGVLISKIPALSGSIAVASAMAVAPIGTQQSTVNITLQDVAGVFASYTNTSGSGVQTSAYSTVAESLGAYALATGGTYNAFHTLTIPSIFQAFASPATLGSTAISAEVWLTKLIKYGTAGDLGDIYNAADIFGVALYSDTALQSASIVTSLEASIASDIGATASSAGWQALISLGGAFAHDNGNTTLATLRSQLDALLNAAASDAENTTLYGNITANETPVVNM